MGHTSDSLNHHLLLQAACSGIFTTSRYTQIPCSDVTAILQARRQTPGLKKQHCGPALGEAEFLLNPTVG